MADGLLIGQPETICRRLEQLGESKADYEIIPCDDSMQSVQLAAEQIHRGQAGVIMKGAMQTSELLRGVLDGKNDLRDGSALSVCGNFELPNLPKGARRRLITITDPALNIRPDLTMKEAILQNALRLRRALGDENPKAAVIAASEQVSAKIPESADARDLQEKARQGAFGICCVEGPLSLDIAIDPEAAAWKGVQTPVAGDADILLMPDLISANVLAKAMTSLSGAGTAGIVMGARVPVILVSRAASAQDKFYSIALAAYAAAKL